MFAATLAIFTVVGWLALSGDRDAFLGRSDFVARRSGDAVVLAWRGSVEPPMADRLAAAFEQWADETDRFVIDLDSPGGRLEEGGAVIDEIKRMKRTHAVDTRVRSFGLCLSMCVPIFLAGEARIASPSARFMFHEPTAYDVFTEEEIRRPDFERRMDTERYFRRYFASTEMNPDWGVALQAQWDGRDVWKTARELVNEGSGIVTDLK